MIRFLVALSCFAYCSGFQPQNSLHFAKGRLALINPDKVVRQLSDDPEVQESIPERGLTRIELDTVDIVRETPDVIEPTDAPHSEKWGFHVKGPKITSGHLIDKDKKVWDNLERHHEKWEQKVEVHEIKDIDPMTVTALCFAALFVNFVIFANWGDAGLSGLVARIMNYMK